MQVWLEMCCDRLISTLCFGCASSVLGLLAAIRSHFYCQLCVCKFVCDTVSVQVATVHVCHHVHTHATSKSANVCACGQLVKGPALPW